MEEQEELRQIATESRRRLELEEQEFQRQRDILSQSFGLSSSSPRPTSPTVEERRQLEAEELASIQAQREEEERIRIQREEEKRGQIGDVKEEKKERDPEEEAREQINALDEGIAAIFEDNTIQPFETDNFNVNNLIDRLRTGVGRDEFKEIISDISAELQAAQRPLNIPRLKAVIKTLGRVARGLHAQTGLNLINELEEIINENVDIEALPALERRNLERAFVPVNVHKLIDELFGSEVKELERRNLSQNEINEIRRQFQQDLENLEGEIKTTTEEELENRAIFFGRQELPLPPLFGENTFRQLQEYIDTHVENDQLRLLLLGDIQRRIAVDRERIGIQLGNAPPLIIPISATRVSSLTEPFAQGAKSILQENLVLLNERAKRITRSDGQINRSFTLRAAILKDDVLSLTRNLNDFVEKNQIRNFATGELATIPTQDEEGLGRGIIELLKDLKEQEVLFDNEQKQLVFSFVPIRIRDPTTGRTRERIIQDLQDLERNERLKRVSGKKPIRQLKGTISKRAKFPSVSILQGMRRRKMASKPGDATHGARMREIRIQSEISLEELTKISNMLIMESGSLEDVHERPLLTIIKGQTTIQDVVAAIMAELKANAGHDFSLVFVPKHIFGGMFLDGALDVLHKNRMLINPVGGNIFGDILNIGKSILTAPLNIVSGLVGGAVDRSEHRRPHRLVDSPQDGGALVNPPQTVGEHQIEPHVHASGGDNSVFRIQPFPFGGKISSDGFIDHHQLATDKMGFMAKRDWADIPVLKLTRFI